MDALPPTTTVRHRGVGGVVACWVALMACLAACGSGDRPATTPASDVAPPLDGKAHDIAADVTAWADVAVAVDGAAVVDGTADAVASAQADGQNQDVADTLADVTLSDAASAADVADGDAAATDTASSGASDGLSSDGACVTGGQPPPGLVADIPPPPLCAAVPPLPWFDGKPPAATLAVEIGWRDAAGQWHAYSDGDWVPLYVGTQGGFMVMPVTRVLLPGQEAPTVKMQYQAQVLQACAPVASSPGLVTKLVQAPTAEAWYQTDPTVSLYVQYDAPASQIGAACGLWVELLWRYRPADAAIWGEKRLRLRTYIASMAPIPPGG